MGHHVLSFGSLGKTRNLTESGSTQSVLCSERDTSMYSSNLSNAGLHFSYAKDGLYRVDPPPNLFGMRGGGRGRCCGFAFIGPQEYRNKVACYLGHGSVQQLTRVPVDSDEKTTG